MTRDLLTLSLGRGPTHQQTSSSELRMSAFLPKPDLVTRSETGGLPIAPLGRSQSP
jgi:hypothetical protein